MQSFKFHNIYGTVNIGNQAPYWLLPNSTGVSGLTAKVEEQKAPFQDGTTYLRSSFNNRFFLIQGYMTACNTNDLNMQKAFLSKVFNPKILTELTWSNENHTRKIDVRAEKAVLFSQAWADKGKVWQKFSISLRANNPFWRSETTDEIVLQLSVADFKFPLSFDPTIKFSSDGSSSFNINNSGDVETPVYVEFNGPAENPKVINTYNGITEFIEVNTTLDPGEKLIIDTSFGNKTVIFDDGITQQNALGLITQDSTFFQLGVGDNQISYDAANPDIVASVLIKWDILYLGQ